MKFSKWNRPPSLLFSPLSRLQIRKSIFYEISHNCKEIFHLGHQSVILRIFKPQTYSAHSFSSQKFFSLGTILSSENVSQGGENRNTNLIPLTRTEPVRSSPPRFHCRRSFVCLSGTLPNYQVFHSLLLVSGATRVSNFFDKKKKIGQHAHARIFCISEWNEVPYF